MKQNLPPLTQDLIDAFVASAALWLTRLLGVLTAPRAAQRKRLLHRFVCAGERWVEYIIFCMAGLRLRVVQGQRRAINHRVVARPGFRIAVGTNRLLWKSARIRLRNATFIARVTRLFEALAHPEIYIARYAKRLTHGLCFRRLVAFAPTATALSADPLYDVALRDTS